MVGDHGRSVCRRSGAGHRAARGRRQLPSTGADLSIMGDKMDPEFLNYHMLRMNRIVHELAEGPKPVIAEVDGWAVGGGFGLALAADITYATERALFMMSFVRISIIPDLGCAYLLTRRVGLNQAKELALTGKVIDATEALRIGLVNRWCRTRRSPRKL